MVSFFLLVMVLYLADSISPWFFEWKTAFSPKKCFISQRCLLCAEQTSSSVSSIFDPSKIIIISSVMLILYSTEPFLQVRKQEILTLRTKIREYRRWRSDWLSNSINLYQRVFSSWTNMLVLSIIVVEPDQWVGTIAANYYSFFLKVLENYTAK